MPGLDPEAVAGLIRKLLAAIEAGELEASGEFTHRLQGALVALSALGLTAEGPSADSA